MQTLLLSYPEWDIGLDSQGNIALAPIVIDNVQVGDAYAQAQDVASQIRLFIGELLYDTTQGIPYFAQVLGKLPPTQILKAYFIQAALLVPGIVSAQVFFASFQDRTLTGQVQLKNSAGQTFTTTVEATI